MSTKHALIVDDSRIAQVKLRKMLARYDLEVTCVNSAEEALSYLSYKLPAVVFMDHMMQGMDGFEALRVIKSNPDTAMVPIIMYTSKTGDLYVGQARALGAIDVLTKDVIEPSNLDRVLEGVKIYPKFTSEADAITKSRPAEPASPSRPAPENKAEEASILAIDSLRSQIARMLEIHIIRIKQEIGDSNKLFMKRLFREIQEVKSRQSASALPPAPAMKHESIIPVEEARPRDNTKWLWTFLMLSLVAMSLIFFQLYQSKQDNAMLTANYARLNEFIETKYDELAQTNRVLQKNMAGQKAIPDTNLLYEALVWSVNRNNLFPFGQQALGEEQLNILSSLVGFLHTANFSGTISIDVHFGNFCLIVDENGKFIVPPSDVLATKCQFIPSRESDYALEDQQSWPFLNFLLTSPILQEGKIRIDMESHGIENPPFEYPSMSGVSKASEWNNAAQMNQRVMWDIIPD